MLPASRLLRACKDWLWQNRSRVRKRARRKIKTLEKSAHRFARWSGATALPQCKRWIAEADRKGRARGTRPLRHSLLIGPGKSRLPASVVHVVFGTDNFSQSLSRLRRSANRFGVSDVRIYRLNHPALRRALDENPVSMRHGRRAFYWVWKPYILLDTMASVEDGTTIIYSDAGLCYIADPTPLIQLAAEGEVVLFTNLAGFLQRHWTKRDCFVLMQADSAEYWNALQLDASIQLYRAGPEARSFLLEVQNAVRDPRILSDDPNTCALPNFERFRAHRHDQSILTNLAVKHRITTFPSPKIGAEKYSGRSQMDRAG